MMRWMLLLGALVLSSCTAYHIKPVGELPDTTIRVHAVVALEAGVGCGALAFVDAGKLVGLTGGCVEGSLAGPAALLGKLGGLAGGLMMVSPQDMEAERNRRLAGRP